MPPASTQPLGVSIAGPATKTPFPPSWCGFWLWLSPHRDPGGSVAAGSPVRALRSDCSGAAVYFISTRLTGSPWVPGVAGLGDAPGPPWDPELVAVWELAGCFLGCLGSPLAYCQPRRCGTGCPVPAPSNSAKIHFYTKSQGTAEAGGCGCRYRYRLLGQPVVPGEHWQCWEKGGCCIPPCQMA